MWGIGFQDRPLTPAGVAAFLGELRGASSAGGAALLGGVPSGWRTPEDEPPRSPNGGTFTAVSTC